MITAIILLLLGDVDMDGPRILIFRQQMLPWIVVRIGGCQLDSRQLLVTYVGIEFPGQLKMLPLVVMRMTAESNH